MLIPSKEGGLKEANVEIFITFLFICGILKYEYVQLI